MSKSGIMDEVTIRQKAAKVGQLLDVTSELRARLHT